MATAKAQRMELVYPVPETDPRWVLEDDDNIPETSLHGAIIDLLKAILHFWVLRYLRDALVLGNVALRWDRAHPKVGVDPDVLLVEPAPPGGERRLRSLLTWKPGYRPPRVAVEVVSRNTAAKDYGEGPDKYAASGTKELWVFDPERFGPSMHGGPYVLQVWRRDAEGRFARVYAGEGPARTEELGGWLVVTDGGTRLRLADDERGERLWPTEAEAERAAKEKERAAKEKERAAKEAALARIAELEAELARRGG